MALWRFANKQMTNSPYAENDRISHVPPVRIPTLEPHT
jgi:hypothetical protein